MSLLVIVLGSALLLLLAYRWYGGLLARLLRLDPRAAVPAVAMRDDVDFVPLNPTSLFSQHFSAIAAAGPIVGPIVAGAMFGWLPALLWIVLGSIFIGGVHDLAALVASVRHKARSIAEVVRQYMTPRAYVLFLAFIWLALVYVVVAFTDITAGSFFGNQVLENGVTVNGGGIATSSMLYLALPVAMGLLMRYARLGQTLATIIFLPLVGVAIWAGQHIPFDLSAIFGLTDSDAHRAWNSILLVYCFVASLTPMWVLLQPRGYLGGYFLFIALVGGMLGLVIGGQPVRYPAFLGWHVGPDQQPLMPLLFITVACGACSGFHAMVATGTTSKQLRNETDAKPIAYGGMLLEGMVAVVSLCCVMMLTADDPLVKGKAAPNLLYAAGVGKFLQVLGVPPLFAVSFALMAFTTFVYDTLDVCTRLGRYVMQELTGWHGRAGRVFATAVTTLAPLAFLMRQPLDPAGEIVPAWKIFWNLFGASNQLLAALTLVGVTVWLARTRRAAWVWLVTGLPAAFMYVISVWELLRMIGLHFAAGLTANPVPWVAVVLVLLALLMLVEACGVLLRLRGGPPREPKDLAAAERAPAELAPATVDSVIPSAARNLAAK